MGLGGRGGAGLGGGVGCRGQFGAGALVVLEQGFVGLGWVSATGGGGLVLGLEAGSRDRCSEALAMAGHAWAETTGGGGLALGVGRKVQYL